MATSKRKRKRWSHKVTEESNALDLEQGVFSKDDPRSIAQSLKRSADRSRRRKADPFRSAMSMLIFYINRGGKKLSKSRRKRLEAAKEELRDLYGRHDIRGQCEPIRQGIASAGYISSRKAPILAPSFLPRVSMKHHAFGIGHPENASAV